MARRGDDWSWIVRCRAAPRACIFGGGGWCCELSACACLWLWSRVWCVPYKATCVILWLFKNNSVPQLLELIDEIHRRQFALAQGRAQS
jgi:hypothetical protein